MLTAGFRWAPDTLPMNKMTSPRVSTASITKASPAELPAAYEAG
jgi:hypothetical protein